MGPRTHAHNHTTDGLAVDGHDSMPEELVRVHLDGGLATLCSRRGEVLVKVKSTGQSPCGTVFCSFSISDVPIKALTGSGYDPIADTAELKVCAVRIEPA